MPILDAFAFIPDPGVIRLSGVRVARVGALRPLVTGTIFQVLAGQLSLPTEMPFTFDGLADALADLSWLPPGKVAIVHDELPAFIDRAALASYLEALASAVREQRYDWRHGLTVYFPESARSAITAALMPGTIDLVPPPPAPREIAVD